MKRFPLFSILLAIVLLWSCVQDPGPQQPQVCVSGELEVLVDPDGTANSGDEYTMYVHPTDNSGPISWGPQQDIAGLPDLNTLATANADFNGFSNTMTVVSELGNFNSGNYPASICQNLSNQTGCDWYLPSAGELQAMFEQLDPVDAGFVLDPGGNNGGYWSSTELNGSITWRKNFLNGVLNGGFKTFNNLCRCVRRESI
ncbi:MAG: hypothetical protein AAFR87_22930 [Bacteroidota bacterium]